MPRKPASASTDAAAHDRELVESMRLGDRKATRTFFRRFRPLLADWARRFGVDEGLCDEVASQCLNNAFLVLLSDHSVTPKSLPAYLITALRNTVHNYRRAERRDIRRQRNAVREGAGLGEWVISESCSEHSLNLSEGPDREPPSARPAIERLADALDEGLTAEERRILGEIGKGVPQRQIAEWLGLPYATLRSRVQRLRDRLREVADRYAGHLDGEEQRIVKEFINRTSSPRRVRDVDRAITMRQTSRRARRAVDETDGGRV